MALPAFFDPIVNAPRWQKVALGLVGLAILGAGGYFLLLSPLEVRVNTLRAQHTSLYRELLEARTAAADVVRFQREAAELERRLEVMKDRLPTEKEMPPLYRTLTDAAFQAGLLVSLFQPREGKVRDYYVEIPITLMAEVRDRRRYFGARSRRRRSGARRSGGPVGVVRFLDRMKSDADRRADPNGLGAGSGRRLDHEERSELCARVVELFVESWSS